MKIQRLMEWMNRSTCNFTAISCITEQLDKAGFISLDPQQLWSLEKGKKYYMVKNHSAVFAVVPGSAPVADSGFRIISSHSDSPCFKIKPNAEIYGEGGVVSLNIEKYGGGILYTWFDRPLSMSGRVMTAGKDPLHPITHIIDLKRPVCTIPHLAIHFNRQVNEGNKLSVQKDMLPVMGYFSDEQIEDFKQNGGLVKKIIAESLNIKPEEIIDYELCLYPLQDAVLTGVNQEYIQCGRLDDLSMAYASLEALLTASAKTVLPAETMVMAVFDNEETGSGTKQGAASAVFRDFLERIVSLQDSSKEAFYRAIANSFMISADDAHAWHPNYKEKFDPTNHPVIGGGPAVKINANCKYMTDADGAAVFRELCRKAGVECQYFVNHSDVAGGSTLGNILTAQLDLRGVDMGCPIWAMHSACETAGVSDHLDTIKVFEQFWS